MIVTFCGHSSFDRRDGEYGLFETLCNEIKGEPVDFYIGGYGAFDDYAMNVVLEYKKKFSNAKVYFVTPYLSEKYSKLKLFSNRVDEIIYPSLEKVPSKLAIIKRNEWMIKKADLIIAFVKYSWGGARISFDYAKRLKKKIINLGE